MTVKTIHDLDAAGALVGTEELEVQLPGGGLSKKTTSQAIANLGSPPRPLTVYAADAVMAANAIAVANFAAVGGSNGAPITITLPAAPADGAICEIWSYDPAATGTKPTVDGNGKNITAAGGATPAPTLPAWSTLFLRFNAALDVWLCPLAF